MARTLPLVALLAACAPLAGPIPLLPYPGGYIRGGVVEGRFSLALPGTPLFVDADEGAFYAAYPYELLVFDGKGLRTLPLPGRPRFLRARPGLAVGLDQGVYTEKGLLPYPALDAALTEEGLYRVDGRGLYLEGTRLRPGAFGKVVAWEEGVVALGGEAYFHPEGKTLALPGVPRKAEATACGVLLLLDRLYLLRPEGLKAWLEAEDFAALGERVWLSPPKEASCREVVWP